MSERTAQAAFEALSDPTRRRILHVLAEQPETTAGAVADAVQEVGRTAVSSHLRVLRSAGLVVERRDGRFRRYSLHPDGPVRDALGFLQTILSDGLRPRDAVEADESGSDPAERAVRVGHPARSVS